MTEDRRLKLGPQVGFITPTPLPPEFNVEMRRTRKNKIRSSLINIEFGGQGGASHTSQTWIILLSYLILILWYLMISYIILWYLILSYDILFIWGQTFFAKTFFAKRWRQISSLISFENIWTKAALPPQMAFKRNGSFAGDMAMFPCPGWHGQDPMRRWPHDTVFSGRFSGPTYGAKGAFGEGWKPEHRQRNKSWGPSLSLRSSVQV